MMENGEYRYSYTPKAPKIPMDFNKIRNIVITCLVAVVVLVGVLTCFYTVDDKQQAVVTTFGKVTDIADPGLHFKAPFGIQQAHKVNVNVYEKIEIGYTVDENGQAISTDDSTMITGDYNIVNVDFYVQYKVSDPVRYLYAAEDPALVLKNLFQSQARNVIGSSTVDAVLTQGKESIQQEIKELVSEILAEYDIGLVLLDVGIQDAEPPTTEVMEAFKAVETAKQNADAVVNAARAYQNAQIPDANAKADKLLQNAEYLKQKRINEAVEAVAMFNAMYAEYTQNPDITHSRMYYEAISQILPGVKVYINTGDSNSMNMLLPLESIVGGN